MVVADLEPYGCVEDGVTALKARTADDWRPLLQRLIDDAELRKRIGTAARAEVLRNHSIEALTPAWRALVAEATAVGV